MKRESVVTLQDLSQTWLTEANNRLSALREQATTLEPLDEIVERIAILKQLMAGLKGIDPQIVQKLPTEDPLAKQLARLLTDSQAELDRLNSLLNTTIILDTLSKKLDELRTMVADLIPPHLRIAQTSTETSPSPQPHHDVEIPKADFTRAFKQWLRLLNESSRGIQILPPQGKKTVSTQERIVQTVEKTRLDALATIFTNATRLNEAVTVTNIITLLEGYLSINGIAVSPQQKQTYASIIRGLVSVLNRGARHPTEITVLGISYKKTLTLQEFFKFILNEPRTQESPKRDKTMLTPDALKQLLESEVHKLSETLSALRIRVTTAEADTTSLREPEQELLHQTLELTSKVIELIEKELETWRSVVKIFGVIHRVRQVLAPGFDTGEAVEQLANLSSEIQTLLRDIGGQTETIPDSIPDTTDSEKRLENYVSETFATTTLLTIVVRTLLEKTRPQIDSHEALLGYIQDLTCTQLLTTFSECYPNQNPETMVRQMLEELILDKNVRDLLITDPDVIGMDAAQFSTDAVHRVIEGIGIREFPEQPLRQLIEYSVLYVNDELGSKAVREKDPSAGGEESSNKPASSTQIETATDRADDPFSDRVDPADEHAWEEHFNLIRTELLARGVTKLEPLQSVYQAFWKMTKTELETYLRNIFAEGKKSFNTELVDYIYDLVAAIAQQNIDQIIKYCTALHKGSDKRSGGKYRDAEWILKINLGGSNHTPFRLIFEYSDDGALVPTTLHLRKNT